MGKKYWVPGLEKANNILEIIAHHPNEYRLIDISNKTGINKSSLYSLLNTLVSLDWITREKDSTYSLGIKLVSLTSLYSKGSNIVSTFLEESEAFVHRLNEATQISVLDGTNILYLAKKEGSSSVRLATDPGMKLPAHATAMGKVLLSKYNFEELLELYSEVNLETRTSCTVKTIRSLYRQINFLSDNGYIVECEEAVEGFGCIASPIKTNENKILAAVSVTIPKHNWEIKKKIALDAIVDLAKRISIRLGHFT